MVCQAIWEAAAKGMLGVRRMSLRERGGYHAWIIASNSPMDKPLLLVTSRYRNYAMLQCCAVVLYRPSTSSMINKAPPTSSHYTSTCLSKVALPQHTLQVFKLFLFESLSYG